MSKRQRAVTALLVGIAAFIGFGYAAGFYWGFGDEPDVTYGVDGGMAGALIAVFCLVFYGLLMLVTWLVIVWIGGGRDDR